MVSLHAENNIGINLDDIKMTTTQKQDIFKEFGGSATNTGSVESQVALISHRINHISGHLKTNRKDFSSTRSLYKLVGQRKKIIEISGS
jgi:small subunit ribosomal protein S15